MSALSRSHACSRTLRSALAAGMIAGAILQVPPLLLPGDSHGPLLCTLIGTARAGATDEVIARHIEWLGGRERLAALHSLDLQGTMETAGLSGEIRVRMQRPDHLRLDYDLKVVDGAEVYAPGDSWRRNESGQLEDLGRESALGHRRSLDETFALWMIEPREDITLEDLGTETREGREWRVIQAVYDNGDRQSLYLDAETGELLGGQVTLDTDTYWSQPGDWRIVDGVRLPFLQRQVHPDQPARDLTLRWETIDIGATFAAEVFARPAEQRKVGGLASGATSSGWMEMEAYLDRYIYIPGTINGVATKILLDSGAGMTVVSQAMANQIGLETAGSLPAQGVSGTTTASIAEGIDLELGAIRLDDLRVAVIDLANVEKMMTRGLPVILGKEVFHRFVVDIDYPNDRIAFHEPAGFRYDGPGQALDLVSDDGGHKAVMVRIEDREPALVKIDTGAGDALSLFAAYTDAENLLEGRAPISDALSGGVGGTNRTLSRTATLRSLQIAGYTLENVPASFHEATGSFDTELVAGNMGAGILSRFRCVFDYSTNRLILEPGRDWQRAFDRDRLGISILATIHGVEVIHVASGSPAAAAGWKAGDRVASINGKHLGDDANQTWREIAWGTPGTTVVVRGPDGRVSEMVLADFY